MLFEWRKEHLDSRETFRLVCGWHIDPKNKLVVPFVPSIDKSPNLILYWKRNIIKTCN